MQMNTTSLHAAVYLQTKEKIKGKEIQQRKRKKQQATKINNLNNSINK